LAYIQTLRDVLNRDCLEVGGGGKGEYSKVILRVEAKNGHQENKEAPDFRGMLRRIAR
jgi:hypothetical protein